MGFKFNPLTGEFDQVTRSLAESGSLLVVNNLSDLNNAATARTNLSVYSTSQVDALVADTFETVSKNLDSSNATYNYTSGSLTSIVYANGITKTFNYTGSDLTSIVLSGSTPAGIALTKTFSYTSGDLIGVSYS